jgi:RimJ/RimL family protein N-acetyltransferase
MYDCAFLTKRLAVSPWHRASHEHGIDLARAVAAILTPKTTQALPLAWQGEYTVARARRWIAERDGESTALLLVDRNSGEPVGLMLLHEDAKEHDTQRQLRIGYVIKETDWGKGIASELVAGLVDWARSQPQIGSIIAGVEPQNAASVRVLTKNGFSCTGHDSTGETDTYALELRD